MAFSDATCADADAIILLENTTILNYINADRQIGFNVEQTLAILKVMAIDIINFDYLKCCINLQSLAKFHALGIAMRHLQPALFDSISTHLKAVNLILNDDDTQMLDVKEHILKDILLVLI